MKKENLLKSGLLEQYVLGLTSPDENRVVEEAARKHPEVQEEILAMQQALDQYINEHSIPPPPGLKEEVMESIDRQDALYREEIVSRVSLTRVLLALSIFGLIGLTWYHFDQQKKSEHEYSAMVTEYHLCQKEREALKAQMAPMAAEFSTLVDGQTQHVHVRGTSDESDALMIVYYNPDRKDVLMQVVNLPTPPKGHQYQVWADVKGEMINMGLLENAERNSIHHLSFIPEAESVNVTIEPLGGSDHPTVSRLCANGQV